MSDQATKPFEVYGRDYIEEGAFQQMANVMALEPVVAGALMPDAHQGYGMPIGGVAAVRNALIPYAVGVDIGCRMHLTVFPDITETYFNAYRSELKELLQANTHFGPTLPAKPNESWMGQYFIDSHDEQWAIVKKHFGDLSLKDRAEAQWGTSGGGNHFVEWGILEFKENYGLDKVLYKKDIEKGTKCLALLSHSGSRALGYTIANHFTKLAAKVTPLEKPLDELSWLPFDSEEGQDYWKLMNLAGDYSRMNHAIIHKTIITAAIGSRVQIGLEEIHEVSNHHNFAWRETDGDGSPVFVHRKGATPAGKGQMGFIPGSMATSGYLVRGKGASQSLRSASHGAGRAMSRSKALKTITLADRTKFLADAGVDLISAGLDESPQAYKDIDKVMGFQSDLIDIVAEFKPRIVRMGGKVDADPEEGN